jgi:hypothetical protein
VNFKKSIASQTNARCWLVALALASLSQGANAATTLPNDVFANCTFTQAEFKAIFESGSVSKNGGVVPADSFSFTPDSPCSFYKWSAQMFLWLTSPVPSRAGTGSHVFNSPLFFGVSPLDSNGRRNLIPNEPGRLPFSPVISQRGSKGQEVVFDSNGKVHDVIRPAVGPNGKLLVRDKAGQPVEIDRVQAARDGKPVLLDRANRQIDAQRTRSGAPIVFSDIGTPLGLRPETVLVNGRARLVTTSGAVVETEEGQAGGFALMAQNGSLVFYLLQVNDVWGYFNTGMKNNKITNPAPTTFPITGSVLGQITTVAQQAPAPFTKPTFPDNVAMAVEVKSSWVETTGLANVDDYITIDATVPTYNPPLTQPNNTQSVQSGTKPAKLALVGIHVVGSTLDHPEMLWATFEHVNNTPNPQYTFVTTSGGLGTQPADGPGGWLFSSTGAAPADPNNLRITPNGTTLNAPSGQTIGPSDLVRVNPWGTGPSDPNLFAINNTDIVSLNKNVLGLLAAGDVRKNYILVGTTWIKAPVTLPSKGVVAGSPELANSTMETFVQPSNCFMCHSDDNGNMLGTPSGADGFSGGLSHIWAAILPLFP